MQKEFELHIRKTHKISVGLCNLASLMTEYGPVRPIKSLKEIESKRVLNAEELREKVMRPRSRCSSFTQSKYSARSANEGSSY